MVCYLAKCVRMHALGLPEKPRREHFRWDDLVQRGFGGCLPIRSLVNTTNRIKHCGQSFILQIALASALRLHGHRPEALQGGAIQSRSPRNCGLDLVGMSTLSPATVDNRGRIEIGHPIGNACVRIKRRGDKSASINL